MLGEAPAYELAFVFGRAFLVALERHDRDNAMVFARALLTQFSKRPPRNAAGVPS